MKAKDHLKARVVQHLYLLNMNSLSDLHFWTILEVERKYQLLELLITLPQMGNLNSQVHCITLGQTTSMKLQFHKLGKLLNLMIMIKAFHSLVSEVFRDYSA